MEGDFGAPLEEEEKPIIEQLVHLMYPLLSQESVDIISKNRWKYYPEISADGTPLKSDGSCVYLVSDESGIARCGFEILYEQGKSKFKKPISCHLYPIRIAKEETINFEALNYDRWDICQSACSHGESLGMRLYQFCKESIIRKYGYAFYEELDQIAQDLYG